MEAPKISTFDVTESYRPTPDALEQSRKFAAGKGISEHLIDGFQAVDLKVGICSDGKFASNAPSTVIDRRIDMAIQHAITESNTVVRNSAGPAEVAAQLVQFVDSQFTPATLERREETMQKLDSWYDGFTSSNPAKQYLLGFFMGENRGACQQRALLLKLLLDANGFQSTLVPGYLSGTRHVWVTVEVEKKRLLFDPTFLIVGEISEEQKQYTPAEDIFGKNTDILITILPAICDATETRDLKKLLSLYSELLEIDEKAFGTDHLETSPDHTNLGRVYVDLGDNQLAKDHVEKSLSIQERFLSAQHPNIGQTQALLELIKTRIQSETGSNVLN